MKVPVPPETVETLVIGAGQAGLAMSYWLSRCGRPHLVLERGRVAERWRSERWQSLAFQFPNWSVELPGFRYTGGPPDGFAPSPDIAAFIEEYAHHIAAPVRENVAVRRLRAGSAGLFAETDEGLIVAADVVVATGPYQRPAIPRCAEALDAVFQLHTSAYRNPDSLPSGGILIVGAGASGAQIAEELGRAGRAVWLSVGSHRRVPRRYRGYDFHYWEGALGEWDRPAGSRQTGEPPPLLTGVNGGRDMDLRALAELGITLTGRLEEISGGVARFEANLAQSLSRGDTYYDDFVTSIEDHVASHKLDLPQPEPAPRIPDPACVAQPLRELDLESAGVSTVIWATGYEMDFSWIDLPVISEDGAPRHTDGVSPIPGLYFLGLPWLSKRKSTLLSAVGEDASRLAAHIEARHRHF